MKFEKIDPNTYKGGIPQGAELVVAEEGNEVGTALILLGFDEIGEYEEQFIKPVYGFLKSD